MKAKSMKHYDPIIAISIPTAHPALVFSVPINVLVDPNLPLLWSLWFKCSLPLPL